MQSELMTWSKTDKRWHKGYKGKRFAVSPKQLGTDATKEASRSRANDWWTQKQKEIDDALGVAKKHPVYLIDHYERAIEQWRLFAKWHHRYGEADKADQADTMVDFLKERLNDDTPPYPLPPEQQKPVDFMYAITEADGKRDYEDPTIWHERFKQIKREEQAETSPPKENTLRAHIDDYLNTRRELAEAKGKYATYESEHYHLIKFRKWVEPLAGIETLNETLWEKFCLYLMKQVRKSVVSPATAKGTRAVVRAFIHNRYDHRYIDRPRNLDNRNLSILVPLKEVETFTLDEVKQLLAKATDRKQLYLLLMLNCGMYPVDVASIRQSEVDWEAGRITRKRTKTENASENVPKVDYLLWRTTFGLLKQHRSKDKTWALLNTNGTPLWKYVDKNGKFCKVSNVATAFYQLLKQLPDLEHKPLKALRKTSSTMLAQNPLYERYAQYFLGQAPTSIADRHYIQPSKEQFDAAIKWLGGQYGIE